MVLDFRIMIASLLTSPPSPGTLPSTMLAFLYKPVEQNERTTSQTAFSQQISQIKKANGKMTALKEVEKVPPKHILPMSFNIGGNFFLL